MLMVADQVDAHFLDQLRSRSPHKKGPVMLIVVVGVSHKPMLVAYKDHDALNAILAHARSSLNLLLDPPLCVRCGVLGLQVCSKRSVWCCRGMCPAHGAVRFEIVRRIIVGIKVGQIDV